ncbi:MAG: 4-(cytidine 5'-diphospho)-2-C-methyl-D-erythritol kinase, partial [Thiotrichaceae bacterium]|nr:4-(cytidine 5'-diphospho)-2-C-methyl-D-erythritol kinase [Thiotrichaceae bacterium]
LQTVFQFLDYSDELSFKLLNSSELKHANPLPGVPAEDDLTIRAARLLQQYSNCQQGVEISIKKRLPMGGGLGGGSSDAATTLVALNQLWQLEITVNELVQLGIQLGADVPVFIQGVAAWAEGIGEKISPIQLSEPYFLILIPQVSVSTAQIFSSPLLSRNCKPISREQFLSGEGGNVCEAVVCELYPQVAQAMQWLNEYAQARMTGTGACVFAPFSTQEEALDVFSKKPAYLSGFVAKGLNVSPLYA